ncbi:MAG: hypothetical protein R3B40_01705 [Polyangiales bacterium]|nr:hypothetical protein [Myxococcales bacterium]MCB9658843.1 hypothetical protein [Sandaracinaceae bacterium]
MNRSTLENILDRASGVTRATKNGSEFEVEEGHRVTFYLGRPGQAMEISDVQRCQLHDDFVELASGESETVTFVEYDAIHALAAKPPKGDAKRRAGFA